MSQIDPALPPFLALLAQAPPMEAIPLAEARERMKAVPDPFAPQDVTTRNLTLDGAAGPLAARLYTPPGAQEVGPGIVFFHGGGFMVGDLDSHDGACRRLAKASGLRFLSVDYRLAPEHRLPAAHDDAEAAVKWAFAHAEEIGFDTTAIGVSGDSAGGNLAAWTAYVLRNDPNHRLKAQILLYPATTMQLVTESRLTLSEGYFLTKSLMSYFAEGLLGETGDPTNIRCNLLHAEDVTGVAPAHITTAGFDPLKDEGRLYAEKLSAAGVAVSHVCYEGMIHGFYNFGFLSQSLAQAIDETGHRMGEMLR